MGSPPSRTRAPRPVASATSACTASRRRALASGPICTPSSSPSPTATAFIAATKASVNSGRIRRSTRNRLGEVHTCPAFATFAATQARTAAATSVSAHTMTGACPPSSMVLAFMAAAASPATCLPTGTEPVNATYRITGEAMT
jgi:hypothetical protein